MSSSKDDRRYSIVCSTLISNGNVTKQKCLKLVINLPERRTNRVILSTILTIEHACIHI